ncbi:MAG: rhodanese-like domain-containing protein [Planctomycetota bacterium]
MIATTTPAELRQALADPDCVLIDVRTPAEYQTLHVRGAKNVPLDRLDAAAYADHTGPLYVICQKGGRGHQACELLVAAGVAAPVNVTGGTIACEAAGLAVGRGRQTMSLERQVRIAAGSLVVVGVLLGALAHPAWLGLAGFVGAGLVFAGVTDTCGMGLLLARMPWNQTP